MICFKQPYVLFFFLIFKIRTDNEDFYQKKIDVQSLIVFTPDCSKAEVLVLFISYVALWLLAAGLF